MAKIWKEPLDPGRHVDHFHPGGAVPRRPGHGPQLAYFVRVVGFTFEFASIDQLRACLAWFASPIPPGGRAPVFEPEKGHWQPWHARLPASVLKASRRPRVVEALRRALDELGDDR